MFVAPSPSVHSSKKSLADFFSASHLSATGSNEMYVSIFSSRPKSPGFLSLLLCIYTPISTCLGDPLLQYTHVSHNGEPQNRHTTADVPQQCQTKGNNHIPPTWVWKSSFTQKFWSLLPLIKGCICLPTLKSCKCHLPWITTHGYIGKLGDCSGLSQCHFHNVCMSGAVLAPRLCMGLLFISAFLLHAAFPLGKSPCIITA